ncbi:hypothetical protein [Streptomyces sp. CA-253872]|uniref:hypothetical protein n=1 Tax=Streptomyces sp. CA-253872 TaxID=3240067 RepID=UPI003D924B5A
MPDRNRPHPQEAEIRALLEQGDTNAEVRRRLLVGARAVAEVRRAYGIPPVPRSAWRRRRNPTAPAIHELLLDGHTNAEIARRTGADPGTVARMRARGGYPPATIRIRKPRPHPRDAEIRALLPTMSSEAIAKHLGVDRVAVRRIRKAAGIAYTSGGPATPEEKWAGLLRPVEGGHTDWAGERAGRSGTPVMRFRGRSVSPAGLAFRARTGRDPVGQVRAECGHPQCLTPDHVDDERGRQETRRLLRYVKGGTERPATCRYGHDQAEDGRFESDGTAYCEACKRERSRRPASG